MNVNELIVREGESLRAVLAALDRPGPAIAIAIDGSGAYRGLIDAGSIEQAIAGGHGLDAPATAALLKEASGFAALLDGAVLLERIRIEACKFDRQGVVDD